MRLYRLRRTPLSRLALDTPILPEPLPNRPHLPTLVAPRPVSTTPTSLAGPVLREPRQLTSRPWPSQRVPTTRLLPSPVDSTLPKPTTRPFPTRANATTRARASRATSDRSTSAHLRLPGPSRVGATLLLDEPSRPPPCHVFTRRPDHPSHLPPPPADFALHPSAAHPEASRQGSPRLRPSTPARHGFPSRA